MAAYYVFPILPASDATGAGKFNKIIIFSGAGAVYFPWTAPKLKLI